jgi:hypothetical protein
MPWGLGLKMTASFRASDGRLRLLILSGEGEDEGHKIYEFFKNKKGF